MNIDEIARWVNRLEAGRVQAFELQAGSTLLRLEFDDGSHPSTVPHALAATSSMASPAPDGFVVSAPSAGIFHARHPLDQGEAPTGQRVVEGQVIGFLRVGEAMTGIVAARHGQLLGPEVADGALVGYGCPLFRIV